MPPKQIHPKDVPDILRPYFPENSDNLEKLYVNHAQFREICQNFAECRATLEYLLSCDQPNAGQIVEYRSILRALKAEIVEILVDQY